MLHVRVQAARQGAAEAGQVRAAVPLRDIVGETEDIFLVGIVPLHCQLHDDVVAFSVDVDHRFVQRSLVPVQVLHKFRDAALVLEPVVAAAALIVQLDPDPRIQE